MLGKLAEPLQLAAQKLPTGSTVRMLVDLAAKLVADPAASLEQELPLFRVAARELRRQLRRAALEVEQAGWSEERRTADHATRVAQQQEAAAEHRAAKAAAAARRVGKAQTALRNRSSVIVSFTGAGGNPYSRPLADMYHPHGINHMIKFVMPGWYGTAMGPHHHPAQD